MESTNHLLTKIKTPINDEIPSPFHVNQRNKYSNYIEELNVSGVTIKDKHDIAVALIQQFKTAFQRKVEIDTNKRIGFLDLIEGRAKFSKENFIEPIINFEIKIILINSKTNGSPGIDGIPYEFYLKFWHLIGDTTTRMMNERAPSLSPKAQR